MAQLEELAIDELFDKLKVTNRVLANWTQDDSDLEMPLQFEEAQELSDLILGKPVQVRRDWIAEKLSLIAQYLTTNEMDTVKTLNDDLKYCTHCFMDDAWSRENNLELEKRDIFDLYNKLTEANNVIREWTNNPDSELPPQFKEAQELSNLILGKPKGVRESLFSKQAYSLSNALKREDYSSAHKILNDIKYFAHCFLKDSEFGKDTRTETLRLIADTIN